VKSLKATTRKAEDDVDGNEEDSFVAWGDLDGYYDDDDDSPILYDYTFPPRDCYRRYRKFWRTLVLTIPFTTDDVIIKISIDL
jgi:hypothetical protein